MTSVATGSVRPTHGYYYQSGKMELQEQIGQQRIDAMNRRNEEWLAMNADLIQRIQANKGDIARQQADVHRQSVNALWTTNPRILLDEIDMLFVHEQMSFEQNINALTRFSLLMGMAFSVLYKQQKFLMYTLCLVMGIFVLTKGSIARQENTISRRVRALDTELDILLKELSVREAQRAASVGVPSVTTKDGLPLEYTSQQASTRQLTLLPSMEYSIQR